MMSTLGQRAVPAPAKGDTAAIHWLVAIAAIAALPANAALVGHCPAVYLSALAVNAAVAVKASEIGIRSAAAMLSDATDPAVAAAASRCVMVAARLAPLLRTAAPCIDSMAATA